MYSKTKSKVNGFLQNKQKFYREEWNKPSILWKGIYNKNSNNEGINKEDEENEETISSS